MGENPSHFSSCGDNCPVEMVLWNDIQEFIQKLNNIDENFIYRLPTEVEWEYAARAESTNAFTNGEILAYTSTVCSKDSNLSQIAWYCYNSSEQTHPVAQKER